MFLEEQWLLVTLLLGVLSLWFLLEKRHAANSLDPQQAVLAINSHDYTVVDVRPANAYNAGHIAKSINISYKDSQSIDKITHLKTKKRLLVCDRGMQSKALAEQLQNKKVACEVLKGGIEVWKLEGFPLKSGTEKKESKQDSKKTSVKKKPTKKH